MPPENLPEIDEEFYKRKRHEFEQRKPYSIEEVNEFLLKNHPDLHSMIMCFASRSSHPGKIISAIYSSIYIVNEKNKQDKHYQETEHPQEVITEEEIDRFWRSL